MSITTRRCNIRARVQLLETRRSRHTPILVERITGIPRDQYIKAIDLFMLGPETAI